MRVIIFSLAILLISQQSAKGQNVLPHPNDYEGCCGREPVEFKVTLPDKTEARLFVPNAFTPDGDKLNDLFTPVFNDQILTIDYMVIEKPESEIRNSNEMRILYQAANINSKNIEEKGWNGLSSKGEKYIGSFEYTIYCMTKNGNAYIIKGQSCALSCGSDAAALILNKSCYFSSQSNTAGEFVPSLDSGESLICKP